MTAGEVSYKADTSPVTEIDHAINDSLRDSLMSLLPDAGWLSEEDGDDKSRLDKPTVWIVDPLDGTRELLAGINEWAITVGLVAAGQPVMGGIINPASGEGGAWCKAEGTKFWGWPEPKKPAASLAEASVLVSRNEMKKGRFDNIAHLLPGLRVVGSAAYKLLRVAAGQDDLYLTMTPKSEWDLCGGIALLEGTGMVCKRLNGEPVIFNQPDILWRGGFIAGSAGMAESLRDIILQ